MRRGVAIRLLILGAAQWQMQGAAAGDIWIDDVTIVSPERARPVGPTSVRLHDERIAEITDRPARRVRGVEVIDGHGLFLAPGLIDGHVHLGYIAGMRPDQEAAHPDIARAARAQVPRSFLHFGFTTLIDLNSTPQMMAAWQRSGALRPDTYFCGGVNVPGGYPMNFMPAELRAQLMPYYVLQDDPGRAGTVPAGAIPAEHTPQAVAARMHADGAICMKLFYETGFGAAHDLPVATLNTLQALVGAAHAMHMPVLMHANAIDAQRIGNQAGVDVLAHGLWNWGDDWSVRAPPPEVVTILDRVLAEQRGYQPTIQVLYGERNLFDRDLLGSARMHLAVPATLLAWYRSPEGQWFHDVFARNMQLPPESPPDKVDDGAIAHVDAVVSYLAAHAANFSFGSDTPSDETFANPPGLNGFWELQRLVDAGMTPAQVFRAATSSNARIFGLHDVGTVQVGRQANLLLLRRDPSRSLAAYDGIMRIILHGRVIDPATLAADAASSKGSVTP
jgi:imidazolonepropionase-like amidohydrolase